jgi:uncharacterized repeat protein (TIGR02543 family)
MSGANYKKGGFIVLAAVVLTVCFSVFLLTANFRPSLYSVTFIGDDGFPVEVYTGVEEGRLISAPEDGVKEGLKISGWFKDADFENEWIFEVDAVRRDTVLFAKWEVEEYLVGFRKERDVYDGGFTVVEKGGYAQLIPYGEKAVAPYIEPTKDGYDFDGWEDTAGNRWDFDTPIVRYDYPAGHPSQYKTFTLYAIWKPHTYRVTFKDGDADRDYKDVRYGEKLVKSVPDPVVAGKTFLGWYTVDDVLWDFDAAYNYASDITLYAKYETDVYRATYIFLDGTSSYQDKLYGEKFSAPELPARNAEAFDGWYYKSGEDFFPWNFADGASRSLQLYEVWTVKVEYTGYSEYNDATLSTGEYADEYTPEIEGYAFIGWYTDPLFVNKWNFNEPIKENIVLYPKFEILEFMLIFTNNGKIVAIQVLTYGAAPTVPSLSSLASPEANAFFGGWYIISDEDGSAVKMPSGYTAKSDAVLAAVWFTDATISAAPAETVRAYYREKLVAAAVSRYGIFWELFAGAIVLAFDGEAAMSDSYTLIKGAYDVNLALINLMP